MRKTIITLASIVTAAASVFLAVIFVGTVSAMGNTDTAAALIQKGCSDYTEFVLNRTNEGMDTKTIDKLWNEHAAPTVDPEDRWNTKDTCGTVESIAAYAKTK